MKGYSSEELLKILVAFLEVAIIAAKAKQVVFKPIFEDEYKLTLNTQPDCIPQGWALLHGICTNLFNTESKLPEHVKVHGLLYYLFSYCPSSSGNNVYPVKNTEVDGRYSTSNPNVMWGDHPYADNRRQIIAECIEQLQVELESRGYNLR